MMGGLEKFGTPERGLELIFLLYKDCCFSFAGYGICILRPRIYISVGRKKYNSSLLMVTMISRKNMHLAIAMFRSSRPEVFCKKGVLKNFIKLTGKHLC